MPSKKNPTPPPLITYLQIESEAGTLDAIFDEIFKMISDSP